MNEGCHHGGQNPGGSKANADAVDNQRPDEVLQNNGTRTAGEADNVDELQEIIPDEDHIRTFSGDVSP